MSEAVKAFFWLGCSIGCIVGWFAYAASIWIENEMVRRLTRLKK